MPRNTSITLGEHFDEFVAEQIKQGRYQSVSEIVRSGLRKLEDSEIKRQQLRAKLEAAENTPLMEPVRADEFLAALHAKHRA
jgi:antitoxin ParD1/3/4